MILSSALFLLFFLTNPQFWERECLEMKHFIEIGLSENYRTCFLHTYSTYVCGYVVQIGPQD